MTAEAVSSETIAPRVLVFFDYACPFCYLDWPRFKRLRAEHGAELVLCPFELRPDLPERGIDLDEVGGHSERVLSHMLRVAAEGGLSYREPERVPNSRRAMVLGEYARDAGPETHEAVHEAIWEAYFANGADIGSRQVLLDIAKRYGLDADDVERAWDEGRYEERLHQFTHLALALGVRGTPAALICNELLLGTRPYEVLKASVLRCMMRPLEVDAGSVVHEGLGKDEEGRPPTIDGR